MTCSICALATLDTFDATVTIDSGALEGKHFGAAPNAAAFLGVPYATAPVGNLRWKPPLPASKWRGTRPATQFGSPCPQLPARWFPYVPGNEDCLYLNVWTPDLSVAAKLPVLVYLHGGSNTQGYSQMTPVGPALSPLGLVVVSANYRLGPFGFLAHAALTAESEHHASGNYGLLDQVQALKWVQENIARFGGDPARVTVMGQSAGAVDICLLIASPLTPGLFQRAIMESGDCQGVLNEDIRTPISENLISGTGEQAGNLLAHDLGFSNGPHILQALRSIPASEILKAWSQDPQLHFDAIVDGWVVPEQPSIIFAEGKQMHISVLAGSNADEATVFGHNNVKTVEQYKDYLRRDTGEHSSQELQVYPVTSDGDVPAQSLRLENDSFAYGAYSMARGMAHIGQGAYLYYFTYSETGKRAHLGAYHGEELNFLSKSFPDGWEHSQDEEKLGEEIRGYWAQFAKSGDPNMHGLPDWPAFVEHRNEHFELGRNVGLRPIDPRLLAIGKIWQQIATATIARSAQSASN